MRAQSRHDQVTREVKYDIADVKQRQTSGDLVLAEVENRAKIMVLGKVHGLGKTDIGSDGGADEVEGPKGGNDAKVELPRRMMLASLYPKDGKGVGVGVPVDSFNARHVDSSRPELSVDSSIVVALHIAHGMLFLRRSQARLLANGIICSWSLHFSTGQKGDRRLCHSGWFGR